MPAVLLVEDEAELAELIAEALGAEGLQVRVAGSDQAAYQALEDAAAGFTALVTDINLGVGTTGFDIARRARQLNERLQVVYITGHAAHMSRFGVEDGVMFPKPFNPTELALRVKSLVQDADEA
jgi:DNA-binding response OmpR family regulator